jgi:hypothetical protein
VTMKQLPPNASTCLASASTSFHQPSHTHPPYPPSWWKGQPVLEAPALPPTKGVTEWELCTSKRNQHSYQTIRRNRRARRNRHHPHRHHRNRFPLRFLEGRRYARPGYFNLCNEATRPMPKHPPKAARAPPERRGGQAARWAGPWFNRDANEHLQTCAATIG